MLRFLIIQLLAVMNFAAIAQVSLGQNEAPVITRQCSAIRELVYQASQQQFKAILKETLKSSNGFQTDGSWQFSTTRYAVDLQWQEASACFVEHQHETTDSTITDTWQYVAEYRKIPDILESQRLFLQLNNQILGCPYPLSDTLDQFFTPLPDSLLPLVRPPALEVASLYELKGLADTDQDGLSPIMLMVGMEKRPKDFLVSLMVEHKRDRKKISP